MSAQQFLERLMLKLPDLFSSLDELRQRWADPDEREVLLLQLAEAGFDTTQLNTLRTMFHAEACDLFDLLAFLTHETPMHTRAERAAKTRDESKLFERYGQVAAQAFLEFILEKYERTGCVELSRKSLANLVQLAGQGTITQLSKSFGGSAKDLLQAFIELQHELYHCV
jgi:type I restriction enzyme R subunit